MKKLLLVLFVTFLFYSCKDENPIVSETPKPPESIGNLYPKSSSVQIKSGDLGKIVSLSENSIVFSDGTLVKNLRVGSVIFSEGYSSRAPKGFLRRINSISANTIYTSPASLEEAFSKGSLNFTLNASTLSDNMGKPGSPEGGIFSLNYLVYDKDNNYATIGDQLKTEGSIKVSGSINGGIEFPPLKVSSKCNLTIDIDLDLIATGGLSYGVKVPLFVARGAPVLVYGVVLTPEFSVEFNPAVSVQSGTRGGLHDKISINSSVLFESEWKLNNNFQNTFSL